MKKERIEVRLPAELKSAVEAMAARERRSVNSYIVCLLAAACDKAEEQAHNKPLKDRKKA